MEYTAKELSMLLGTTESNIIDLCHKFGIKPEKRKINSRWRAIYNQDHYKIFYSWLNRPQTVKKAKDFKPTQPVKTIEDIMAEHPLVKDKRFFSLSYFPDVRPNCFDDIEAEVV